MIIDAVVIIAGRKWPKNSSDFKSVIDDGPCKCDPPRIDLAILSTLVLPFINTVTFADGACEARSLHRLVVAPRFGLRRAPNKLYRIYESEY